MISENKLSRIKEIAYTGSMSFLDNESLRILFVKIFNIIEYGNEDGTR